ncbi:adenylate/guanylate cyclase domain-containing protein [Beijerinckia mobilis]|uniref:adenylate/guanylate cyclase domain-containing protein n=1 Tax=Beijerinckia mobilis TaxID=231434 RepID=UPI0005528191|nr:adenylate/guanylate cyclase domain-containing protein [Beijerinckia mobilis]
MRVRAQLSFTITILIAFTLVFAFGLGLAVLGFRSAGERAAVATANVNLGEVVATVAARTNALVRPALALVRFLADTGITVEAPFDAHAGEQLLAVLAAAPEIRTISVAWPDGSLLQAAPVAIVPPANMPETPAHAAYVLAFSRPGAPLKQWIFLAADHSVLHSITFGAIDDPRRTQWYLQARNPGVYVSTPYRLGLSQRVGLSISSQLAGGGVVSVDVTLSSLGTFLRAQQVTPNTLAFLFSDLGILLAYPDDSLAVDTADDGHVKWTTLQATGDALLGATWDAYATGQLVPGHDAQFTVGETEMLARLESIESLANPPVLVAVVAPRSDFTAAVDESVHKGTLYAIGAFMVGLGVISLLSWRIARPLGVLTREAQAIRRFELSVPLLLRSRITEVERLTEAMAAMKRTLSSFAAYLPRDLVRQFLLAGTEPRLGGERVTLSVMFSDIQGFTTVAEKLDPMELTNITSVYFDAVTRELLACGGTIDKYIGDAVMAFWNAPSRDPHHASNACAAALRARAVTVRLAKEFIARGWPALPTRFGVHTGVAVVGNVGSSDRMTYTAMGGMVNLANRLEGLNKLYGTQILVSEATRAEAGPGFVFRSVDIVIVKGAEAPLPVHELVGLRDHEAPPQLRAREADIATLKSWEACVEAYREGRFDAAREALAAVQTSCTFPVAAVYAERLAALESAAPPDWTPLVRLNVK